MDSWLRTISNRVDRPGRPCGRLQSLGVPQKHQQQRHLRRDILDEVRRLRMRFWNDSRSPIRRASSFLVSTARLALSERRATLSPTEHGKIDGHAWKKTTLN